MQPRQIRCDKGLTWEKVNIACLMSRACCSLVDNELVLLIGRISLAPARDQSGKSHECSGTKQPGDNTASIKRRNKARVCFNEIWQVRCGGEGKGRRPRLPAPTSPEPDQAAGADHDSNMVGLLCKTSRTHELCVSSCSIYMVNPVNDCIMQFHIESLIYSRPTAIAVVAVVQ